MGDYAEMYIDDCLNDHLDYITYSGIYDESNEENIIADYDYDDCIFPSFADDLKVKICYEFKTIHRETDRSRLVEMTGGAKYWISKKHSIIKTKFIFMPRWYAEMLIAVCAAEFPPSANDVFKDIKI